MIERYREITPMGKYGHIWLVVNEDNGKVYVKKLLDVFNQNVYEKLGELHHKNIPDIVEWCREEDGLYVIEEYLNGETLEEKKEQGYYFPEAEAIEIMMQLCDAVEVLHRQEPPMIHRDIKLSNIMVTGDGIVKLIDYNASRIYDAGANKDTTLIGTVGYAAPEQFGFGQTDKRTDIYAMGVVLNELLTNHSLSEGICEGRCRNIVEKCVQMDPDNRYQDAEELRAALAQISGTGERAGKSGGYTPKETKKKEYIFRGVVVGLGYFAAVYLSSHMNLSVTPENPVLFLTEKACLCAHLLFMAAVAVNYGGIARKLPVVKHKRISVQVAGFILWWQISRYGAEGVYLIIKALMGIG